MGIDEKKVFIENEFTNKYSSYHRLMEGREFIIFNQIYANELNDELVIASPPNGISKYSKKISEYMNFLGYNCKDIIINAYKNCEDEWNFKISNGEEEWYNEWYANLSILHPFITISDDGKYMGASFLLYTYVNNEFTGRFDLIIRENEVTYFQPIGRDG